MAKDATESPNSELESGTNAATMTAPRNLGDSHLLTGKKLTIAFSAMLMALLRTV